MSVQESKFLQWFAGIAATLIVAMTIGAFSVLSSIDVMAERIQHNTQGIKETREMHKRDLNLIRGDMAEIKDDTKEIKSDIKKLMLHDMN